ncbi:hypothetical protein F3Y22_tig00110279pilonHSYRG00089 [Hibiscus syriacus]|uniref:RNase H type-1 domain-containing protein n=1 Tax=Hibiscus syriacus TaxID=106335 RepID=A0A6A3B8N2_HIBSY|nr:hypothetical protein F3Y22_tig00110279pilonHSYRG00089 [Hibiscus syriacus]
MMSRISQPSVRTLSRGGKLVLIKAVLQYLPTYQMSLYALPVSLCRELNSAIARFWWRSDASVQAVHWLGMSNMRLPKSIGGLGIRDLEVFNQAFLCKQGWRLFNGSKTLVAQVLKAKYYPDGSFLTADLEVLIIFFYVSMRNERLQMPGTFISIECFGHNRPREELAKSLFCVLSLVAPSCTRRGGCLVGSSSPRVTKGTSGNVCFLSLPGPYFLGCGDPWVCDYLSRGSFFGVGSPGCGSYPIVRLWTIPPAGFIKVNVDGSYDKDLRTGGICCVLRDSTGQFLAGCSSGIPHAMDAFPVESLACLEGLNLALSLGCRSLVVE